MTAEDFDPLGEDGVARGLSIGPRFFCIPTEGRATLIDASSCGLDFARRTR